MTPRAGVDSKRMQLLHRIAALKVVNLLHEGRNCCKTEPRGALRHQTEGPLLRIAERRSLADKHHQAGWLDQPFWGCPQREPERDKVSSGSLALTGQR
jgi:hypothetical protein